MAEVIACPTCGQKLNLPDSARGLEVRCSACRTSFAAGIPFVEVIETSEPVPPPPLPYGDPQRREFAEMTRRPRRPEARDRRRPYRPNHVLRVFVALTILGFLGVLGFAVQLFLNGPRRPQPEPPFAVGPPPPPVPGHFDGKRGEVARLKEEGEELRVAGQFAQAAGCYRKALDLEPTDFEAFLGLFRSLMPGDARDDVEERFLKLARPREHFDQLVQACRATRNSESLELLCRAMVQIEPHSIAVDHARALILAWTNKPTEALAQYRVVLNREANADRRQEYTESFIEAMAYLGKVRAVYTQAVDAREAFRVAAAALRTTQHREELRRLISLHRQKFADDPVLHLYEGELLLWDGLPRPAHAAFQRGASPDVDPDLVLSFRHSRVQALFSMGQPVVALNEIGPRKQTYDQLVSLCLTNNEIALLDLVIAAQARTMPTDPDLRRHRLILRVRQGQIAEALKLFKNDLNKQADDQAKAAFVEAFLSEMARAGKAAEALAVVADPPAAFRRLADELIEESNWDALQRLTDAYAKKVPNDANLSYFIGELHLHKKEWNQAASAYAEALKTADADMQQTCHHRYVFAVYKAGRGLQAYRNGDARKETYTSLAQLLINDGKWTELDQLIALHRPHAVDAAEILIHEMQLRLGEKKLDAAARLLARASARQEDANATRGYVYQFVNAALPHFSPAKILASVEASQRTQTFDNLANRLAFGKDVGKLQELVEEYGKSNQGDQRWKTFMAEVHLFRNELPQAEKLFSEVLAEAPPHEIWRARSGLQRVAVKGGKAAEHFRAADFDTMTFDALMNYCLSEKDAKQLRELVALRRQDFADDPNLTMWELEARWLAGDYRGAWLWLNAHRDGALAMPRHRWKCDAYRVRCLIKLDRKAEAVREAEELMKSKRGWPLLLVLAHAANGDVAQAIAAAEKQREQRWEISQYYADEELGPILRSDAFKAFRDKIPPPDPTKPNPDDD